jgi:hypothetical protein
MSGGGGMGNALGNTLVKIGTDWGGKTSIQGRDSSMPAYGSKTTNPSANYYASTYTPMQQNSQQSPMQQAPQQTVQNMGLEALYQSMANQFAPISQQQNPMDQFYQQPTQRQMPTYQNPALNYRPDMSGITANLNRVAPRVTDQQMHPEQYAVNDGGSSSDTSSGGSYA